MNARNSLKSLVVSSDSEPEVEPFITQTKAALVAVLQELLENNLNLHLRMQKTSKQLTISIFTPRIFRPTCMFTDKEDSGRGITTQLYLTRKFSRGMKQEDEYHKTQRDQLHVFMEYTSLGWLVEELLTMTVTLSWNRRILKTLFNFELSFWLWKSMSQQLRKSVNVAQKKRSSV